MRVCRILKVVLLVFLAVVKVHLLLRNQTLASSYGDSFNYGYNNFDASKGETKVDGTFKNDVYGKSDHLQTNNITIKYWKRIA